MIKPMPGKIFVELEEVPNESEGGILLTDNKQQLEDRGEIRAVGEGESPVQVGDKVLFAPMGGYSVKDTDGEMLRCLNFSDIWAVI